MMNAFHWKTLLCIRPNACRLLHDFLPLLSLFAMMNLRLLSHCWANSNKTQSNLSRPRRVNLTIRNVKCRSSRRSSDSGTSVDSEVIMEAERLELERMATRELEQAMSKPVAFSVRTNISFDATLYGVDAPSPSHVISYEAREFLHIKQRFNQHWWIGRLVRIGSPLGFIPSPAKLETIHGSVPTSNINPYATGAPGSTEGPGSPVFGLSGGMGGYDSADATLERGRIRGGEHDHRGTNVLTISRQRQSESPPPGPYAPIIDSFDDMMMDESRDLTGRHHGGTGDLGGIKKQQTGQHVAGGVAGAAGAKRKGFSRKAEFVAPYEIVPCMRPIVFVGPALKGYEVTDMMQKVIFDAMKKHFDGRIIISRVSTNISLAKRVGALLHLDKKNIMDKSRSQQLVTLLEVQQDLERIFHLGSKMQLLLLDCDTINHPSQISKTCLAPIVVYIKIKSTRVLNRLIKTRGKLQKKNASVQTTAAEKLLQCPPESFDYVVEQNTFAAATEGLCGFLESYWVATHPPTVLSKAERMLGVIPGSEPKADPDTDRPLVPLTPGRPGLSVVTKAAIDAGFTSQEISVLTGARAAGFTTETGLPAENELGLTGPLHGGGAGELHSHYARDQHGVEHSRDDVHHLDDSLHRDHEGRYYRHQHPPRLHVEAAQEAAMAAAAAGLSPHSHTIHSSASPSKKELFHSTHSGEFDSHSRGSPGLAMGIGMGLASGVAATIQAALFQGGGGQITNRNTGPIAKVQTASISVAAAASVKPPPLKELGIHQVESSDGTHVYQSRSARQAKQRQAELERVRREAEAKALAIQATVGGRRRRRGKERDRRQHSAEPYMENRLDIPALPQEAEFASVERHNRSWNRFADGENYFRDQQDHENLNENFSPGGGYPGTGPQKLVMTRACPIDD